MIKSFVNANDVKTKFSKVMMNVLRLRTCFKTRLKLNYHNLPWTGSAYERCSLQLQTEDMVHCRAEICSAHFDIDIHQLSQIVKQKFFILSLSGNLDLYKNRISLNVQVQQMQNST